MAFFGSSESDPLEYAPRGEYVTADRVAKIADRLRDGERVQYLTRGTTIDTQRGGNNSSLFGDDRSRKTGTRGWVRAAFTDDRVVVKIPQLLGTDDRSIPYSSITAIDLDTGLVKKRITIQTPAATYHIEVDEPGKSEVRDAVDFARQQVEASD